MGFGSNSLNRGIKSGFRSNSNRSGTTPAHDWANFPDALDALSARILGVVIENRDALEVMIRHDGNKTLHYVDPPYVHSTRSFATSHGHHGYKFEMTDDDHRKLAACLCELEGAVIVSGYHSELYDELYAGWDRVECKALADGARERTEVLWMKNVRTGLFGGSQ
jgi:DNA adenine methylase